MGGEQRLLEALRAATLGEYEILGEIGRGGMAVVFLAYDIALERKVALKLMSPALMLMDPAIQARFKREARTAAALSHPHIIPVYAVKDSDDLVYFVMKYIEGRSLEAVIDETGPLPVAVAVTILQQAGGALAYAHRKGVIHRDVKPGNIMLDEEGWVVVSDFGIAKVAQGEALTATGGVIGTPAYMSPEQCQGLEIGGATDQYALGIVAYEMLAGRPPFEGETMVNLIYDHCHTPPEPIGELRPECPPDLAATVMRMLAKQASDRFPTIDDALAAIGPVEETPDEARTQMLTFVQKAPTTTEQLIEKFRTPGRPLTPAPASAPRGPTKATPLTPAPVATSKQPAPKMRWAAIGIPFVIVASVLGWLALQGPGEADSGTAADPATVAAPAPAATPNAIDITPSAVSLDVGAQTALTATARDAGGQVMDAPVTWESHDPAVATVTGGVVTAFAAGTARVTARSGPSSATVTVLVSAPRPATSAGASPAAARIAMSAVEVNARVGESTPLRADVLDARGQIMRDQRITWNSTAPSVATVSSDGRVTGRGPGTATVIASAAGLTATARIVVGAAPVGAVDIVPRTVTVQTGEAIQLQATTRDNDGGELRDRAITWRSSDPSVAQVSGTGRITGAAAGTARITAESEGIASQASVTVEAPAAVSRAAPDAPADPRPSILAEIDRYRQAIASEDIARLRSVDPSMTAERQRSWEQFFDAVTELTATFSDIDLQVAGDRATARVSATYHFRVGRPQTQETTLTIELRQSGGQWRIASVN